MSRRFSRRLVVAALALLAACAEGPAADESSGVLSARATAPVGALADAGMHRLTAGADATLYVPKSIPAGAAAPFLLLLHGAGGKGDYMIRRFKDEADKRGIVLLAPDSVERTWDVALSMRSSRDTPRFGKDVARIDAALSQAFAQVNVDPKRVAVAGFSDGASYALSIGSRNSMLFPATLAFSAGGMVPGWTGPPGRVFISHGAKDRILPIAIPRDELAPALRGAGFKVEFVTFDGGHEMPDDVLDRAMTWWLG